MFLVSGGWSGGWEREFAWCWGARGGVGLVAQVGFGSGGLRRWSLVARLSFWVLTRRLRRLVDDNRRGVVRWSGWWSPIRSSFVWRWLGLLLGSLSEMCLIGWG